MDLAPPSQESVEMETDVRKLEKALAALIRKIAYKLKKISRSYLGANRDHGPI